MKKKNNSNYFDRLDSISITNAVLFAKSGKSFIKGVASFKSEQTNKQKNAQIKYIIEGKSINLQTQ